MARLEVRVALVHGEPNVVLVALEVTVSSELAVSGSGGQERITTLGAEEVLFVVRAFTKVRIVERDEHFINDRRLAMVAQGSKSL